MIQSPTRKTYDLETIVAKLLPHVEEFAHGWLLIPSKDFKRKYRVHVSLVDFSADFCECYGGDAACVHKIVAERFYSTLSAQLSTEPLVEIIDERTDAMVKSIRNRLPVRMKCRVSRLSHAELDRYTREQLSKRELNPLLHN